MNILGLELKNFGKFTNKKIEVKEGIHVFYGENEAGKSTIHSFIKGMLFGIERGRGRASANDVYSIYEPWDNPNYYAGVLRFECGGKQFRLERNFDRYSKKAVLICENDGEELSVEDGDLEMLLGGLQAAEYGDTVSVGQLDAKTSQQLAAEFKNYATNYYSAGSSEIDLAGVLHELAEKRKRLEKEVRLTLQEKQGKREKIEQELSYVWRDLHGLESELSEVEIELSKRREKEEEQVEETNNRLEQEAVKWRIHPVELLLFLVAIVCSGIFIDKPWNYLVAIIIALVSGIYVWNRMKDGKKKEKTKPEIMLETIAAEEEELPAERILWEKEHLLEEIKEKQVQYENLKEQLEELDEVSEQFKEQDKKRAALILAFERLGELSKDMQRQLGIELNESASDIMKAVTDGAYERLVIEENLAISLMSAERKLSLSQVSKGTIEQAYFSLRMAINGLMHEEEYPIILDDTFAFYDETRLEHTLRWLQQHKKQVLLFTCHKREEELLQKWNIPYSKTQI